MTARAATVYYGRSRCVIEGRRCPGSRRGMAGIALGRCADMGCRLGLCILGSENPAVAIRAFSCHAGVVHRGRRPAYKPAHMAGIALRRGRNMDIGFRLRVGEIVGTAMAA